VAHPKVVGNKVTWYAPRGQNREKCLQGTQGEISGPQEKETSPSGTHNRPNKKHGHPKLSSENKRNNAATIQSNFLSSNKSNALTKKKYFVNKRIS